MAVSLLSRGAGVAPFQLQAHARGRQHAQGRGHDLRADAVAFDDRHDVAAHAPVPFADEAAVSRRQCPMASRAASRGVGCCAISIDTHAL